MFGACQEALLIGEDVVEDEKLGGDGVALPHSAAAALPLLATNSGTKPDERELQVTDKVAVT